MGMIELFNAPADYPFIAYRPMPGSVAPITLSAVHEYSQVITNASDETIFDLMSLIPVVKPTELVSVIEDINLFKLNFASNDIARQTRRGLGNVCLCAEGTLSSSAIETFHNRMPSESRVIVNNEIPKDELWVFYIGMRRMFKAADQPFAFANGTLRVHTEWTRYCKRMAI